MTDYLPRKDLPAPPEPARYVWIVEDDDMQEVCNTKEAAAYWQRQWLKWTPDSSPIITRFAEAPE